MHKFKIKGHPNIRSEHRTTLEFTKESDVTLRGDCILGVSADFSLDAISSLISKPGRAVLKISMGGISDSVTFDINPEFSDMEEIVIRKGTFTSSRTLGINADKSACDIDRLIVEKLKRREAEADIELMREE